MRKSGRHQAILQTVSLNGSATVIELAEQLAVSSETIRRDVKALVDRGSLVRFHGGVQIPYLLREPAFEQRLALNAAAKKSIARAAAGLVEDGDSLMFDTGSTTSYVARALREHRNLLVVTSSVDVARCLAMRNDNRVFFAGSELRNEDGASVDNEALRYFGKFSVAKAFLAVGAIDADFGPMEYNLPEAELSRVLTAQSEQRILVVDHTKFGRRAPIRDVDFSDIDVLMTDRAVPARFEPQIRAAGTAIHVVTGQPDARAAQGSPAID